MKIEPNLILNWINFKLKMKTTWIESFKNPRNQFQDQTKSSFKTK
jgi:hypothetical protein